MPDRVFSEEEVKAIIRRASARQEEEAERREAREHGLTLADLEQLGTEVGLDPRHLRAAADEVRTGRRTAVQAETETDTHVIVEHWVDRPFSPEAWEDSVSLLRSRFGIDMGMWYGRSGEGRVERVGRAHEWVHMSQLGVETRVSASEREGRTRLILSQRVGHASPRVEGIGYGALIGLVAGPIAGAAWGGALGVPAAFVLVAVALAAALIAAPIITRLDRGWRKKKLRGLKELAVDIEDVFGAASPQTESAAPEAETVATEATSDPAAEPAARIDLDSLPRSSGALPDEEPGEGRPAERSRTRS